MEEIKTIKGTAVPLMINDIDTDRIIPARFLRCVTFDGIGKFCFYDERFEANGNIKSFPMNEEKYKNASIIVAGANFGCGSSREHAPQSIKRAGINAVIAESFAEIFHGNSLTIGLVCVSMTRADINDLAGRINTNPSKNLTISLEDMTTEFDGAKFKIFMPDTARIALMHGSYDLLSELIKNRPHVEKVMATLPY